MHTIEDRIDHNTNCFRCGATTLFETLENFLTPKEIHFRFRTHTENPAIAGHYPHQPLYPDVLLLEAIVTACKHFAAYHFKTRIALLVEKNIYHFYFN